MPGPLQPRDPRMSRAQEFWRAAGAAAVMLALPVVSVVVIVVAWSFHVE